MNYREFWEAGYKVFGLYGVLHSGKCACGNPDCKAIYKHPRVSNWQHTPHWSEEQLETMEEMGHFDTGYGVLMDEDLIAFDTDARNGGVASWMKLTDLHLSAASAGMIVNTGSGGGSQHHYFKVPRGVALVSHLPEYPGVDFRSGAAFVVGPGSMHASGNKYTVVLGSPDDIDMLPDDLADMLRKPERHRADLGGVPVDVSHADLQDMLACVPNDDVAYDDWIKVGMSLHHASNGTAYDLWDWWSSTSSKYDPNDMGYKWSSFGKSANPVTLATLAYHASQHGWTPPVTFTPDIEFKFEPPADVDPDAISVDGLDLNRPPGFVGRVAEWIGMQPRRLRDRLSSMAAIQAVGTIMGQRYTDDIDYVTTNLMTFNVSGSGTGKEAVQKAMAEIMQVCGLARATYGTIKSEQEVIRNLVRDQPAIYLADEVGSLLKKVKNAQSRGGAPYLEGVIHILMSAFSKGDSYLQLGGDLKEEIKSDAVKRMAQIEKQIDEDGEKPYLVAMRTMMETRVKTIDQGLKNPFLVVAGYVVNEDFEKLVDHEIAVNGFIGRSLLCVEHNTTPPNKDNWKRAPMPESLMLALQQIALGGSFDNSETNVRIEYYGPKIEVKTDAAAAALLMRAKKQFDRSAEDHKSLTGLEAMYMRAYEQVAKVSTILGAPGGLRTEDHVRWAYALVERDIRDKMLLVEANDRVKDDPARAMKSRILSLISGDDGETLGVVCNKARGYKREAVEKCLDALVKSGSVAVEVNKHKYTKAIIKRYRVCASKSEG